MRKYNSNKMLRGIIDLKKAIFSIVFICSYTIANYE